MAEPVTSAVMLGLGVAGSAVSAGSTLMGGNAQADALSTQADVLDMTRFNRLLAGKYKAQELNQAADTTLAASQREAMDFSRNKDLLLSKARAAAGSGASDTSVINTMAGIEQQGEFQKAIALFGGLDRSAGLKWEAENALAEAQNNDLATTYQANMMRYNAKLGRRTAAMNAAGTLLSGAGSAFGKYGGEVFGIPKSAVEASEARLKAAQVYGDAAYKELLRRNDQLERWNERPIRWG
ncbi:hypothetical protein [Methylocystis echinoides]|uniref:Uncharacterized protein n=1 Tax=Methylocystis echinoides TaxID=29468 RepID=A0A9W6GTY6_9HYPH|nr:hypothetical protein [Methylocystis echinoides]GLI92996.1 hypothetical protein LMG27198_19880 [Methylocystis echinoides]